jgi:hypothetical protein
MRNLCLKSIFKGYPCKLALGQLQEIEAKAALFTKLDQPKVKFIKFNN